MRSTVSKMRRMVLNFVLLAVYYLKIIKILKKRNLTNFKLFQFKKWHHGYGYLTALLGKEKVFVKFDTKLHLLQNDFLAYKIANNSLGPYLIKIYTAIYLDDIQIIISEFSEGAELTENDIFKNPILINKIIEILSILNNLNIIHRDIKLDNFLIIDNQIKIIDFTFANSLNKKLGFKELDLSSVNNCTTLEFLGNGFNPKPFVWNDLIALKNILNLLSQNINIDPYVMKIESIESKTYTVNCI